MSEKRDEFLKKNKYNPIGNNYPFDLDEFVNREFIDKELYIKKGKKPALEAEVVGPFNSEEIEVMHEDRGII